VVMNASSEPVEFRMPAFKSAAAWELMIDTAAPQGFCDGMVGKPGEPYTVGPYVFLLFRRRQGGPGDGGPVS
jgi:hypothetical protein